MAAAKKLGEHDEGQTPVIQVWGLRAIAIFHLYLLLAIAFFWQTPHRAMVSPILGYASKAGLLQWWNMFAPNAPREGVWVSAKIRLKDGRTLTWEPPSPQGIWPLTEIAEERVRKLHERVRTELHQPVWPVFAHQIPRSLGLLDSDIESVDLFRSWVSMTSPYGNGVPGPKESYLLHRETFKEPTRDAPSPNKVFDSTGKWKR